MKNLKLILLLAFSPLLAFSQGIAPLIVKVVNYSKEPQAGETILFVGEKSKKVFSGTTDAAGQFRIEVAAGDVYDIKIKSIGDDQDYSALEIPELPEGQHYGESEVIVKFEPARIFTLNNVFFASGRSTIDPKSYPELNELVDAMKAKPNMTIEIAGHTDNIGDEKSNMLLSQQRAEAVKKYLISKAIASKRIEAVGYGETQPVEDNNTEEGRMKNRRTEVRVISY